MVRIRERFRKILFISLIILIEIITSTIIVSAVNFGIGDIVEVYNTGTSGLVVRGPNACDGQIGGKFDGDLGLVLDGPVYCNSYYRWKIRWEDGLEGWSAEGYPGGVDYLKKKYITPSTKFNVNDKVKVNTGGSNLIIRTDPPELAYKGIVSDGTKGTIKDGPFYGVPKGSSGFYHFWKVDYGTIEGWSAENYLEKVTPECTSGPCCDTSTNTFRPSTYKCQEDVTTDYGCPWGTGCGADVGVHHQDRHCSGSSAQCDGALQWDFWTVVDYCSSTEVCVNDDSTCNYDVSCESCSCGSWQDDQCGGDSCSSTEMHQTRTCTPSGCDVESKCIYDESCESQNGPQTEIFLGQGFDKCEIAIISQMQNWITNSPYGAVNLYIGGSCRSCSNSALTASYLSQLSEQGWKFIPTWVGPQSVCWSGGCGSISNDPSTAYNQGKNEANAAIDVAINLGLASADGSDTIIYYDLEGYGGVDTECRNAAKSFISGWTAQLHARGSKAGVYGSACSSALSDFAGINNVPDGIWPAHWIYNSYNSDATVWDVACISNDLWGDHQRIRQYAGGHDETWGGVTLNIDSNVIDGVVVSINEIEEPAPTITSSLEILQSSPYYVGDNIDAEFTIKNKGTAPITFDVLTAGGRFNDGTLPNGEYPDFTFREDITLNPDESYGYQGSLYLTEAGNYHFFCAYNTSKGWNPNIPTESGVTNVLDITVYSPPECYSNSDCGTDGWTGNPYCSGNDVYQHWRTWTCNNPGQVNAYCSYSDTSTMKQDCGDDYCGGWGTNYCKDDDVWHSRTCYDKGCSSGNCFSIPSTEEQKVQDCDYGCSNGQCIVPECTSGPCCDIAQGKFKPSGSQPTGYTDDTDGFCTGTNGATSTSYVYTRDYYCNGIDANEYHTDTERDTCGTCEYCSNNDLTCNYYSSSTQCSSLQDCDYLNNYHITGTQGATSTSYCKYADYNDNYRYCDGAGSCSSLTCPLGSDTITATAGTCKYIAGCSGSTSGTVENYAAGTPCGTDKECDGEGNCILKIKKINISLSKGLNLISLPLQPINSSIEDVIKDLNGQIIVWNYNASDEWTVYDTDSPFPWLNTLHNMNYGKAYWLKSTINQTLTLQGTIVTNYIIGLKPGWNFVGYNMSTDIMPNPISGLTTPIVAWAYYTAEDEWKVYDTEAPFPWLNTLTNMTHGRGYWLKSNIEQDWQI